MAPDRPAEVPAEFWELIEKYRERLMSQSLRLLGNHADAEDVVQETYSKAFRDRDKLTDVKSVGAWLLKINHAHAIDRLRVRRRSLQKNERKKIELPERSVTTGGFSGIELREMLTTVVERLPASLRAAIVLRYLEHLSHQEIAARLNIPLGTVAHLLAEASTQMYFELKKMDSLPQDPGEKP